VTNIVLNILFLQVTEYLNVLFQYKAFTLTQTQDRLCISYHQRWV